MKTLQSVLTDSETYLRTHGTPSPRTDAQWLIAAALELNRLDLYLQFDRPLAEPQLIRIREHLKRCARGEPVQYIVGSTGFHDIELRVGPGVLTPRPETERLVELALAYDPGAGAILDLCTGSGAVLLALRQQLGAGREWVGVDLSAAALAWAEDNRKALGFDEVELLCGDLFAPVAARRFALIVANPPYVSAAEYDALPRHIAEHEPREALLAGVDGLDVIRRLASEGQSVLSPGGCLLTEIGAGQGAAARGLFAAAGWSSVEVFQDYNKRDRVVVGRA